jgi:hypothetical protein
VTTTLPEDIANPAGPTVTFDLEEGEFRDIRALADFSSAATRPVLVGQFHGIAVHHGHPQHPARRRPGAAHGPARQQWRTDYVFLTPNKYAFDFVQIVARPDVDIFLDETPVRDFADCARRCAPTAASRRLATCAPRPLRDLPLPALVPAHRQLPHAPEIRAGRQGDGVHVVRTVTPPGRSPRA